MGSNKFNRALGHLKSTSIDEKIRLLDEQPTNNTTQIYIDEPDTVKTITLNPNLNPVNLTAGDTYATRRDTSGLFMPDGTILTEEPPGDTSYILGPMAAMYYTWSYPWTMIGYIRQSDRKMVNLGRIDGKLSDWNGTAGNAGSGTGTFSSYGQLTLEQAVWFRDIQKQSGATNDPSTYNYYAYYPGPPSQTPDAFGRYPCVITGISKNRSSTTGDPATDHAKGINPEWGLFGDMFNALKNFGQSIFDALNPGSLAQLGARMLRSLTDAATYAGDYIFKGLAEGVEYLPDFTGASNIGLPKIADMPGAVARWFTGGEANPVSNAIDNAVRAVIGENYASQYFTPDVGTAVKYAGDGGTVVAIPRTEGKRGIKNWLGSNVSRGFDPSKGVEQLVRTGDAVAADAAGATQKFALNNADDVARMTQLASQGSKANTILGKLGRAVPFVGAAAATADVSIRTANGDYAGALLGGISAVPGPVGWVGLGAQVISDATGITNPNSPSNKMLKGLFGGQSTSGRGAGRAAFAAEEYLAEEDEMSFLSDLRAAMFEMGVPSDRNQYAREQCALLISMGINPGLVMLIAKSIQQEPFTPEEENYIKKNLPTMISMFGNIREQMETAPVSPVKEHVTTRKRILREIKNDVVLPDEKKEKLKGYRPKTYGKLHAQYDKLMQKAENPATFKPMDETTWTKQDKYYNTRLSQERKNEVLDHLGTGDHFWEILTETGRKRGEDELKEKYGDFTLIRKEQLAGDTLLFLVDENGKKETILQSEYSDRIARQIEEPLWEQETLNAPNDPLIKRVRNKLATQIDYPDKPSRMGYPDGPTPQQIDGWHPEYGKRAAYYNALDPQSADSMPATGDPETDQKVLSQKTPLKPVKQVYKKKGKPNS